MRSADAIPPTGHPVGRSTNATRTRRWATLLLLIVLVLAALPQPTPTVAQPDLAETLAATTVPDTAGLASDPADASDEPTAASQMATSVPTDASYEGPLADPSTLSPATEAPVEVPVESMAPEPALADPSPVDNLATTQTPDELSLVTAADATVPTVCQLVIRATALSPPPGTGIGDPLTDPVAGAAFDISVTGGGSIILLTNSEGILNLTLAVLVASGLAVTTSDTVTVTQLATRAGLSLGEPVFTMTFGWLSNVSGSCRVEAFVINPVAVTPPSATTPASAPGSAAPSIAPTLAPSLTPSPSPSPSVSPSPSPTATATQPVVTATTVPTATAAPTIPVGFGQIDVIVVARPSVGALPGAPQVRLAGARLSIVNRTTHVLTATITTGPDGSARSPLLAIGSYDLILDNPPTGYLGAQAQGFDVASPTLQSFVFQLEVNTAPTALPSASVRATPSSIPGTAPATVRPSNTPRVSPTVRATATTRAGTATATTRAGTATATTRAATATATFRPATATTRPASATPTAPATASVQSTGTARPATATQRPGRATSTPRGTAGAATATATTRAATATTRPATAAATVSGTATTRPATAAATATATATVRPTSAVATATNALPTTPVMTGTPPRPTRPPTGPAATATRTPTPRPAGTTAATATKTPGVPTSTIASGAGASGRPTRPTATIAGTATRMTQIDDASITVYVSICIDPRFIDFGEFGSETDLGPRYLTDIDRSRCRPARSGETRITLTSTYPNYLPAYAQTNSTDANGQLSFVFPAAREQRIGSLHLEGPIPAQDAGVKINPNRVLVIPLTIVILDPAIQPTALDTTANSGPAITGDPPLGWLPGTLAIIGLSLALLAIRQSGYRAR